MQKRGTMLRGLDLRQTPGFWCKFAPIEPVFVLQTGPSSGFSVSRCPRQDLNLHECYLTRPSSDFSLSCEYHKSKDKQQDTRRFRPMQTISIDSKTN
jgi:hypothetical protein